MIQDRQAGGGDRSSVLTAASPAHSYLLTARSSARRREPGQSEQGRKERRDQGETIDSLVLAGFPSPSPAKLEAYSQAALQVRGPFHCRGFADSLTFCWLHLLSSWHHSCRYFLSMSSGQQEKSCCVILGSGARRGAPGSLFSATSPLELSQS